MTYQALRNKKGYSLLEVMTTVVILAIVIGLLYGYQNRGWELFYKSYGSGLSQVKAKLAMRTISDDLREANKSRISVGSGPAYGVPFPDDANYNSPHVYFTKPIVHEDSGETIAYDYVLYYFSSPKSKNTFFIPSSRNKKDKNHFLILKSIKFLNQSKFYTESSEKKWPFNPPILELYKSTLPEDESYIDFLNSGVKEEINEEDLNNENLSEKKNEEEFLDHFGKLKKDKRNLPISGNFHVLSLTEAFSTDETNFSFGYDYKTSNPVKIMVEIEEPSLIPGSTSSMVDFEISVVPRN